MSLGHYRLTIMRQNSKRLKLFVAKLKAINSPLLLETDLAIAFFETLRAENELHHQKEDEIKKLKTAFRRHIQLLVDFGGLEILRFDSIDAYQITLTGKLDAEQVYCCLDPFSYLSHQSAMHWHGLANRIPNTVFISHPDQQTWRKFADEKIKAALKRDIALFHGAKMPTYRYPKINKIQTRPINTWTSSLVGKTFYAAYKHLSDRGVRIATIGRTFLDMVREPGLCGGMSYVRDIYMQYSNSYKDLIIQELDTYGSKIEKVRAGYLMEQAGVSSPIIDSWAKNDASRGGSRKLDPQAEYSDHYDARWSLSIND